ncbi:unnamed protein product [Thlaspi arvense]|uniref:F-box domain-containing protein n=1 Tax=Thlaspi arvense TaxID=13288 RepID=A0AAU9RAY0_THLAR|nr:unnamed protein product [Thlaspi arvense]
MVSLLKTRPTKSLGHHGANEVARTSRRLLNDNYPAVHEVASTTNDNVNPLPFGGTADPALSIFPPLPFAPAPFQGNIPRLRSPSRPWYIVPAPALMKRKKIVEIPLDLLLEILTKLPAKSLTKFQIVSKKWLSIIRSQGFIDTFVSISSTRSRVWVAFANGIGSVKREKRRLFYFSSSHEGHESSSLVTNLDMTIPYLSVTRQVISLPILPKRRHLIMRFTCLCYDPVYDQFKALSLIASLIPNHDRVEHLVLTLKGDKTKYAWRQIQGGDNNIPPYSPLTMRIWINGKVYYGAWPPKQGMNPVIMCFDVRSEKITFIRAPVDVVDVIPL